MDLAIILINGPACVRSNEEMMIFFSRFEELISTATDCGTSARDASAILIFH